MKKSLPLLAALAVATASFAQTPAGTSQPAPTAATHLPTHRVMRMGQPKTPEQRADQRTAMLTKKLTLSADQQAKVHQILLAQAQEAQALKARYPAKEQHQARHQARQAGRATYQQQLQAVLSADQYGKLMALEQAHHRHGGHPGRMKAKS